MNNFPFTSNSDCRFLLYCENLILWFHCHSASNYDCQILSIVSFSLHWSIWNFKIQEIFFQKFYADIFSSPLIRNLQYLQDYMYNRRGYQTLNMLTFFTLFQFTDFKNYAMSGSIKDNPKLERSIALFNGLSQWIQCMVLSKTTPQQRADVIVKFVNVAKVKTVYFTCKIHLSSL